MISGLIKARRALLAGVALTLTALGAMADIEWLERDYDFGAFREAEGLQTGRVRFVNRGPEPTIINRVRLTCGCTSESHTEGEIAPGDTATITFTYNPKGRPGRFEKGIRVFTGTDNRQTLISMRGTVIGAPQTLSVDYPAEAGALRLQNPRLDFGRVRHGTSRHLFINAYNQGNDTLRPKVVGTTDPSLDIGLSPEAIAPGDLATFSIYLNTRDMETMGPQEFTVDIDPADGSGSIATLRLTANIEPDTSGLTPEQVVAGPRIYCMPENVDLGIITGKDKNKKVKFAFTISNEGKSDLNVGRVASRDKRVRAGRWPVRLKPGKNGQAEGTLDASALPEGPFRIKIEIYSDDALHPVRSITLCGEKQ